MIIPSMPNAEYHATKSVGSSQAKLVLDSIQLFKDERDGLIAREKTAAMAFGTLAHTAILEPDVFSQITTATGPINPGTGKPYGLGTVKFTEWQAANPGVTVVPSSLYTMMDRMPEAIRSLLRLPGQAEASVFTKINCVDVKCRPDKRIETSIYDLKTIDDIDGIDGHIRSYRFWFSAAWYRAVMKAETGEAHTFDLIFAEKKPPHRWRIVQLSPEYIEEGDYYVRDVIDKISRAQEMNDWRDKSPIYQTAAKPPSLGSFDHGEEL